MLEKHTPLHKIWKKVSTIFHPNTRTSRVCDTGPELTDSALKLFKVLGEYFLFFVILYLTYNTIYFKRENYFVAGETSESFFLIKFPWENRYEFPLAPLTTSITLPHHTKKKVFIEARLTYRLIPRYCSTLNTISEDTEKLNENLLKPLLTKSIQAFLWKENPDNYPNSIDANGKPDQLIESIKTNHLNIAFENELRNHLLFIPDREPCIRVLAITINHILAEDDKSLNRLFSPDPVALFDFME